MLDSTSTPPPAGEQSSQPAIRLRPISLEEEIALEAYREAIKAGLTAADGAADKVMTASLSIATAYAGLLALVKPDKEAAPIVLALPFIAFGIAALAAAWALAMGVTSLAQLKVEEVRTEVDSTLKSKRFWTRGAVVVLIVALGIAAGVVVTTYGAGAATSFQSLGASQSPAA